MKRITITLSEKAEKYFNEVAYSLDKGDGKIATNSEVVNYILESMSAIEDIVGDPLTFIGEHVLNENRTGHNE